MLAVAGQSFAMLLLYICHRSKGKRKKKSFCEAIDLYHIVSSLSLAARYLARFRVTLHTWDNLQYNTIKLNYKVL